MKSSFSRRRFALLALGLGSKARGAGDPYRLALPGYRFEFPRDHFNHPEFQTEWWYYTGNLQAAQDRRFGFELTFFRQAVDWQPSSSNIWDVQDVWMARESGTAGRDALDAFLGLATMNVALYASLSQADRASVLTHPEYGSLDVDWIIHQTAGHQIHHLKQLEAIATR